LVTTALAISATLLAVVALVLVGLLLRRLQREVEDLRTVAASDRGASARMNEGAMTRTSASPSDFDATLSRTLEAARAAGGGDAALLVLNGPNGTPVVATLGLERGEAERLVGSLPHASPIARSVALEYPGGSEPAGGAEDRIRAGVAVPLRGSAGPLGMLTVLTRGGTTAPEDARVAALEELAERSTAELAFALELAAQPGPSERDAATGLLSAAAFPVALERAVAEAHLRGRPLAIVLLELDTLRALADRAGRDAVEAVLADAATRVHGAVRDTDLACRLDQTTLAALLPGSSVDEARELAQRLQAAVLSRPVGGAGPPLATAGVAALRRYDAPEALLARARAAAARAQQLGPGTIYAESDEAS
jgi:diguanylate cyclase (GGDEF)-like protein